MRVVSLESRDLKPASQIIRKELPDDTFFSMSGTIFPLKLVLSSKKARFGYCVKLESGEITGVIVAGPRISVGEACVALIVHFLKRPDKVLHRLPKICAAARAWDYLRKIEGIPAKEVLVIAVSTKYRRQGVARLLLSSLGAETVGARTLASAQDAVSMYEALEFERVAANGGRILFIRHGADPRLP